MWFMFAYLIAYLSDKNMQGVWSGGQTVQLQWMKKEFVFPWTYVSDGLDYLTLGEDVKNTFIQSYQLQLQSRQQCMYCLPLLSWYHEFVC
jgi:hypothetical protein